jgi:hypothetical protein
MKVRVNSVFATVMVIALCLSAFVFTEASAAQGSRKGTGILPLTEAEKATMLFLREEEKLARDVYIVMYEQWKSAVFANISVSEQRHMDAIKRLIDKYGLQDSASSEIGVFNNQELQLLYNELIAKGEQSQLDAFEVGVLIEETDISDLQAAIAETSKADLDTVYGNLLSGSENHLSAFNLYIEGIN